MRDQENGNVLAAGQGIWSAATRKYESIEDIRSDRSRLTTVNREEYNQFRREYADKLAEIAYGIMDHNADNEFIACENAVECIVEAVRESKNAEDIYDYLQEYPRLTVREKDAQDIAELVENIASMPAEYFEAKPRRAVGFDEVKAVIAPDSISEELKTAIEDADMELYEYEAGNDEDRIVKVNEAATVKNVRFSITEKMTDEERYEELKAKRLNVAAYNPELLAKNEVDLKDLET